MSGSTLVEPDQEAEEELRFLVLVLDYDDLCAERSRVLPLGGAPEIVLGRADGDEVVASERELLLPDRWMSGRHARIERRGDEDWLVDEGSRNGSFVNGARTSS